MKTPKRLQKTGRGRPARQGYSFGADEAPGQDEPRRAAESHDDSSPLVGDALGQYLKEMGEIPLLAREEELALALRLETARRRYRRAALFRWEAIREVVELFTRARAGELMLERQVDVIPSPGLTVERVRTRLPR